MTAASAVEEDWSWRRVVLDRYEVRGTDVLGIGNFSVVRRGTDLTSGTVVAVKALKLSSDVKFRREVFLFQDLLSDGTDLDEASVPPTGERVEERPRSLLRSATTMHAVRELQGAGAALPHPEEMFVRLLGHSPLDAAAHGGQCFCVLELGHFNLQDLVVHCRDMAKQKKRHSLDTQGELLRVLLHLVRALAFLHSRLFVHGDLKPANLMWFGDERGGAWKLIDLDGLLTSSQLVDMRDAEFYTPIYAAPELAAAVRSEGALRVSRRLDIWAAGVTLLEMELLRPPLWGKFEELCAGGEGGLSAFMGWLSETPSPLPMPADPRVASPGLLEVLRDSMLAARPARRSTPLELLAHPLLSRSRASEVAGAPPPTLQPPPPTPPPAKPPTAFQLFQEAHKAELEEQGLKGAKLLQELHRCWKQLLKDGGEELDRLNAAVAQRAGE